MRSKLENVEEKPAEKPAEKQEDKAGQLAAAVWQDCKLNGKTLSEIFENSKGKIDLDENGHVSKSELLAAKMNKELTPTEAKLASVLSSNLDFLRVDKTGISTEDVKGLERTIKNGPESNYTGYVLGSAAQFAQVGMWAGLATGFLWLNRRTPTAYLASIVGGTLVGAAAGALIGHKDFKSSYVPRYEKLISDLTH